MHDFHVHSLFSNDCSQTLHQITEKAAAKGLKGVCITDHVDIDYISDIVFEIDYNEYSKAISEYKERLSDRLQIYTGLELGLQPHTLLKCEAYLKDKEFDFIIGSIHAVKNKELYKNIYLEGITDQEGIRDYFEDLLTCVKDYKGYDVVGHLDVFRRYLNHGEKSFVYADYKENIYEILKHIINADKGIEINTSGTYGLSSFHPLPEILGLYKELGGEKITIGSDSHFPDNLGYGFDAAKTMLLQSGFRYYTIFQKRQPQFIRL